MKLRNGNVERSPAFVAPWYDNYMYRSQPQLPVDQTIELHQSAAWSNRVGQAVIVLLVILWGGNCIGSGLARSTMHCDTTSQCRVQGTVTASFQQADIRSVSIVGVGKNKSDAVLLIDVRGQPRLRIEPALGHAAASKARDQLTAFSKGQLASVSIQFPPAYSRVFGGGLLILAAIGLGAFFIKSWRVGAAVKTVLMLSHTQRTLFVQRARTVEFSEFPGYEAANDLAKHGAETLSFEFRGITGFAVLFRTELKATHRPAGFALGLVFESRNVQLSPFRPGHGSIFDVAIQLRNWFGLPAVNDRVELSAQFGGPMTWLEFTASAARRSATLIAWLCVISGGMALQATYWPALATLASIQTVLTFFGGSALLAILAGIALTAVSSIRLPPWAVR
jgi:hypothetical protein